MIRIYMTEQGVPFIQSYAISLGQLIREKLTLLPGREWHIQTIGL